jgi:hypothetical protein
MLVINALLLIPVPGEIGDVSFASITIAWLPFATKLILSISIMLDEGRLLSLAPKGRLII